MGNERNILVGRKLRDARKKAGLDFTQVGDALGISIETIKAHEKGARGVRAEVATKYARLYSVKAEYLLGLQALADRKDVLVPIATGISVIGTVVAGEFREAFEQADTEWEAIPVQHDSAYSAEAQFALLVRGASMNEFYPEDSYVICVSSEETEARYGDHVVVQRNRDGLFEYTLKELVRDPRTKRPMLMPRSSDPKHQTPIEPQDGVVEIIAIVIGSFRRRTRSGPAVSL